MLRVGLFCVFAPLAFMFALFHHQVWVAVLGTLYVGLSLQAEWAATRYLAGNGLDANGNPKKRRHWSEDEPAEREEIPVNPLGGKKSVEPDMTYYPPPAAREPATRETPTPSTAGIRERDSRPAALRRLPTLPKFNGSAHEVLGVSENARTRTIVHAFRHWIKRFHPDQAPDLSPELANARVQRLTEAKERLLERRRSGKAA